MLVVSAPRPMSASLPVVADTTQCAVAVIDSSESGHGPTDTRHKRGAGGRDHDGLGPGVVRLYAGAGGEPVGFAWSTSKSSRFIAPAGEHVASDAWSAAIGPEYTALEDGCSLSLGAAQAGMDIMQFATRPASS